MLNASGWDFETAPPTGQSRRRDRVSWRREYEQESAQDDEEFAAEMEHFFGDDQLEEGAR